MVVFNDVQCSQSHRKSPHPHPHPHKHQAKEKGSPNVQRKEQQVHEDRQLRTIRWFPR